MSKQTNSPDHYPACGDATGLRDSNGKVICIGDKVRTVVTGNTDFHGEWAIYEVVARGMVPVLLYVTSEKGDKLPRGYTGSCLSDKYDQQMLLWATDLADVRPSENDMVIAQEQSLSCSIDLPADEQWIRERWKGSNCLEIGRNVDFMLDFSTDGNLWLHYESETKYSTVGRLLLREKPTRQDIVDAERMFGCF